MICLLLLPLLLALSCSFFSSKKKPSGCCFFYLGASGDDGHHSRSCRCRCFSLERHLYCNGRCCFFVRRASCSPGKKLSSAALIPDTPPFNIARCRRPLLLLFNVECADFFCACRRQSERCVRVLCEVTSDVEENSFLARDADWRHVVVVVAFLSNLKGSSLNQRGCGCERENFRCCLSRPSHLLLR